MGVLRDFVAKLSNHPSPVDAFLEGQNEAISQESELVNITRMRSLNEKAKIDTAAAAAEFEDYQKTRDLNNRAKAAQLMTEIVESRMDIGDFEGAIESSREGGADIPLDARPTLIERDGLEIMGWESSSTGEKGELGEASRNAVRQWRTNQASAREKFNRDVALEQLKAELKPPKDGIGSRVRKLLFKRAHKDQVKEMQQSFSKQEIVDEHLSKGEKEEVRISLGDNIVGDRGDIEKPGSIYRLTADTLATVESSYENQGLPWIPSLMQERLIKHITDAKILRQEKDATAFLGRLGGKSNISYDDTELANVLNEFAQIENYRADIERLKRSGPPFNSMSDRDIMKAILADENQ